MKRKFTVAAALVSITIAALFAGELPSSPSVIVHEWGTFTSVADRYGFPVTWSPLEIADDLPGFVYRYDGLRNPKGLQCTVRMETPVLYFYTAAPATLSVRVSMPRGRITEWYPRARVQLSADPLRPGDWNGHIGWDSIRVLPDVDGPYRHEGKPSHYYAARAVDAASVRSGDELEKLLFYRGAGFLPVRPRPKFTSEGKLEVRQGAPLSFLAWFENRGGKSGFRILRNARDTVTLEPPELTGGVEALHRELRTALESAGLFPKEAAAMIETWRDSWFEEGSRLVYILPRAEVDKLLPIAIDPAPAALERVFVGRVELLAPWRRKQIESALKDGNIPTLERNRRFLSSFLDLIARDRGSRPPIAPSAQEYLQRAWSAPVR